MISIIIPTLNAEATLARVFSPLIGPTVRGLVTEVLVLDGGSVDETKNIAEATGADLVGKEAAPKAEWVLFLPQGCILGPGWDDEAARHMDQRAANDDSKAAVFPVHIEDGSAVARLQQKWVAAFTGKALKSQAILLRNQGILAVDSRAPEKVLKGKKRIKLRTSTTQISG